MISCYDRVLVGPTAARGIRLGIGLGIDLGLLVQLRHVHRLMEDGLHSSSKYACYILFCICTSNCNQISYMEYVIGVGSI